MTNEDFDDEQEIRRAVPPRARQTAVTGRKKPATKHGKVKEKMRPTTPRPEAMAEAPVRRMNPRPAPRPESHRDLARETVRAGAAVVLGHNGERLTRRRTGVGDKYDVPGNEIPRGWTYQWNPVTILGQKIGEIIEQGDLQMYENGWRAVPASRHPGRWTPPGYEGAIILEGLRLEERPAELTKEAKDEDTSRAKALIRDRTDALRMTQKALPGASVAAQRGNAGKMAMTIDPSLDIDIPKAGDYELDHGQE